MSTPARQLIHTRRFQVDAYQREDGLWDLEARMTDTKTREARLRSVVRAPGEAFHDMRLTITIDTGMNIRAVSASTEAAPYPGECDSFSEVYARMVGLNLLQGFRGALKERLGGTQACTHVTELAAILPTVAVQAFAGVVFRPDSSAGDALPPQLDRCRALRVDGPVVAKYYPRWSRASGPKQESS